MRPLYGKRRGRGWWPEPALESRVGRDLRPTQKYRNGPKLFPRTHFTEISRSVRRMGVCRAFRDWRSAMKTTLSLFALAALAASAAAQSPSTSSFANLNVVNLAVSGGYTTLVSADGNGSPISTSGSFSFTGKDRVGAARTMVFSGSAASSAQYGRLRGRSTARLANSYYNAANPAYVDGFGGVANANGSPDDLAATTSSFFDDTLQFGGALQSGYFARYVFHVDGTNAGPRSLAVLGVTIAGVNKTFGDGDNGFFSADWATDDIPINGTTPQTIHVQFDTLANFSTPDLTDGSTVDGLCDFSSTATLSAVLVVDANGRPVSGVTFTSGSGTAYPVPEPAGFAVMGLAAFGVLRRRR